MKACNRCGETKSLDDFYNHKGGKFGKRSICKTCWTIVARERRRKNPAPYNAAARRWQDKHPEKMREWAKAYYWRNREMCNEKAKVYRAESWDIAYAAIKRWRQENPEENRALHARRRARKRNAQGADYTTAEHIKQRWALYGNCCAYCGAPAATTDHRIPLARGGSHWPANLLPCCGRCNPSKGTRTEAEFRAAA